MRGCTKIKNQRIEYKVCSPIKPSATNTLQISHALRYGPKSQMQKERTAALMNFFIKMYASNVVDHQ